jgi:ABC transport system ATP-binding/permease protein
MVSVQAAIEVRAIGQQARSSKEVTLRDVSLTVDHGELMAIIGGSGSGKTTLLDAMSGLRPPSSGTVTRSTACPVGAGDGVGAGRNIGYIPNAETIHPVLPLGRALHYTAALRSAGASGAGARGSAVRGGAVRGGAVDDALRAVDLAGLAAERVADLDAGQRKRAAIAAELLTEPRQLFLEEPTIGLDPAQGAEVMRRLRRLCDSGTTVVLTTQNPLDAARCDKVAVLATGGHLAFFGTPGAACDYFAADSLDEIYERLAGLGDPAAAWSRRFPQFSRTVPGFTSSPTAPPLPGPPRLVPDTAGPHSAGRASMGLFAGDEDGGLAEIGFLWPGSVSGSVGMDLLDDGLARYDLEAVGAVGDSADDAAAAVEAGSLVVGTVARVIRPFLQWSALTRRNVDVLARSRPMLAALVGAPVAVLLAFGVLLGLGAFDPVRPGGAFWAVFGGFFVGMAYGVPQIRPEVGALRAERFCGLSSGAYVLAKAVVLVPPLAVADAVILLPPSLSGRLHQAGYGPVFVTLLLSSTVALALGLLLSAAAPTLPGGLTPLAAVSLPPVLLAAVLLTLLDHPTWGNWLALAVLAAALCVAATALIARRTSASASVSRSMLTILVA